MWGSCVSYFSPFIILCHGCTTTKTKCTFLQKSTQQVNTVKQPSNNTKIRNIITLEKWEPHKKHRLKLEDTHTLGTSWNYPEPGSSKITKATKKSQKRKLNKYTNHLKNSSNHQEIPKSLEICSKKASRSPPQKSIRKFQLPDLDRLSDGTLQEEVSELNPGSQVETPPVGTAPIRRCFVPNTESPKRCGKTRRIRLTASEYWLLFL